MTGQELYKKVLENKQDYIGKIINVIDGHHFTKGCKFKIFNDSDSNYIIIDLIYKPYCYTVSGEVLMNMFLQSEVEIEQGENNENYNEKSL